MSGMVNVFGGLNMSFDETDIIDEEFGFLTVKSVNRFESGYWFYNCECKCTKSVVVRRNDLISGNTKSCGCLARRPRRWLENGLFVPIDNEPDSGLRLIENYIGRTFGRLEVVSFSRMHRYPSGRFNIHWNCKCECGNLCEVNQSALKSEHTRSCGCYNNEMISKVHTIDLSGRRFGKLRVIERVGSRNHYAEWKCLCDCGNFKNVLSVDLLSSNVVSCGCLSISKLEYFVLDYFGTLNWIAGIDYGCQVRFSDLMGVGNRKLSYDFCVYKNSQIVGLIECQGLQHYEPVGWFGGESAFEVQQIHDAKKRDYAQFLGVELLEIDSRLHKTKTDIFQLLSEYLNHISKLSGRSSNLH